MPMSCDILKIEYFLKPGTIIVVDGRTSNLRFLINNLQRKWSTFDDFKNDQYDDEECIRDTKLNEIFGIFLEKLSKKTTR